jgi:hypothetical protein
LGNLLPAPVAQSAVGSTLYLVGTADAAQALQAMIDGDATRVRAEHGEPAMSATVAVVGSAAEEHRLQMTIAHADAANAELGLPALAVVDLRGR